MTKNKDLTGDATDRSPNSDRIIARVRDLMGDESARKFAQRAGIGHSTLQAMLNGKALPGLKNLVAIARAGGVTIDWLATGEGPKGLGEVHSGHALHPAAGVGFDPELLRDVVIAVEGVLAELGKTLSPDKKGELIGLVYQMEIEAIPKGNRVSGAKIIQMVRAA